MKPRTQKPTVERVERLRCVVRGERVILDADLAGIYGVPTKRLNEQVEVAHCDFKFRTRWT